MQGMFASGQAVRLLVRRRIGGNDGSVSGDGEGQETNVPSPSVASLLLHESTTHTNGSPSVMTQPGTPHLVPIASMTSSISTLATLPSVESSPVDTRSGHRFVGGGSISHEDDDHEWEIIEVGRGLAMYNSVQIDCVKGLKRYA